MITPLMPSLLALWWPVSMNASMWRAGRRGSGRPRRSRWADRCGPRPGRRPTCRWRRTVRAPGQRCGSEPGQDIGGTAALGLAKQARPHRPRRRPREPRHGRRSSRPPGQARVPRGLDDRGARVPDPASGRRPQPLSDPCTGRYLRDRLGERLPRALRLAAPSPELVPQERQPPLSIGHITRPGQGRPLHPRIVEHASDSA